jgi:hypothetical protein
MHYWYTTGKVVQDVVHQLDYGVCHYGSSFKETFGGKPPHGVVLRDFPPVCCICIFYVFACAFRWSRLRCFALGELLQRRTPVMWHLLGAFCVNKIGRLACISVRNDR